MNSQDSFQEVGAPENVWWAYLGNGYEAARNCGSFRLTDRITTPAELQVGDLIVHERRRVIVSVCRIFQVFAKSEVAGSSWTVTGEFYDLTCPVKFADIRDALQEAGPPDGPLSYADGSGEPGDLYRFNQAALQVVLDRTASVILWFTDTERSEVHPA